MVVDILRYIIFLSLLTLPPVYQSEWSISGGWVLYEVQYLEGVWGAELSEVVNVQVKYEGFSDSQVDAVVTSIYANGTSIPRNFSWDPYEDPVIWWIPPGFEAGDSLRDMIFDETFSAIYCDEVRSVILNEGYRDFDNYDEYILSIWDRETGVLLELYVESVTVNGTVTSWAFLAVETNLWPRYSLQIEAKLSKESIQADDLLHILVFLQDSIGFPIDGADITVTYNSYEIMLIDYGDGYYDEFLDTSTLEPSSYTVTVKATKQGYDPIETSLSFKVEKEPLSWSMIAIAAFLVVFGAYAITRMRKRTRETRQIRVSTAPARELKTKAQTGAIKTEISEVVPKEKEPPARGAPMKIKKSEHASVPVTITSRSQERISEESHLGGEEPSEKDVLVAYSLDEIMGLYNDCRDKYMNGEISAEDFSRQMNNFRFTDQLGVTWTIGKDSGRWYSYVDNRWKPGEPKGKLTGKLVKGP